MVFYILQQNISYVIDLIYYSIIFLTPMALAALLQCNPDLKGFNWLYLKVYENTVQN